MSKLAFLFPGQGSQYVGMGKALYDVDSIAKRTFEEANDVLGFDLTKLMFEGPVEELTLTENAQPAILTASIAAFRAFVQKSGATPFITAGHSLGEITALACADAIPFAQAVAIVRRRGLFMQEAVGLGDGAMAAISGAQEQAVQQACSEVSGLGWSVVISNFNSPEQIVISGHRAGVQEAGERLKRQGAVVIPLKVSAPFHSPLMLPAASKLREELNQYTYGPLKWPVISNVTAKPYESHDHIVESLSTQMTHPVRWTESMNYAVGLDLDAVVELGPQSVLCGLMRRIAPNAKTFAYDKEESAQALHAFLAEAPVTKPTANSLNRPEYSVLARCLAVAVCTKNRSAHSAEYESKVVRPYREVMSLHMELEQKGEKPSHEQEKLALQMLSSVFAGKNTPQSEQKERFGQVLEETGRVQVWSGYVSELLRTEGLVGSGNL